MIFTGFMCFLRFLEVLSLCKGFKPAWRMWILRFLWILMIFGLVFGHFCHFKVQKSIFRPVGVGFFKGRFRGFGGSF